MCNECEHVVQIAFFIAKQDFEAWGLSWVSAQFSSVQVCISDPEAQKNNAMKTFTFEECVVELQQKKQRLFDMDTNLVSISGQQVQSKHLE